MRSYGCLARVEALLVEPSYGLVGTGLETFPYHFPTSRLSVRSLLAIDSNVMYIAPPPPDRGTREGGSFALNNPTVSVGLPPAVLAPTPQPPPPAWRPVGDPLLPGVIPPPGT
jgi:hypothetical protein